MVVLLACAAHEQADAYAAGVTLSKIPDQLASRASALPSQNSAIIRPAEARWLELGRDRGNRNNAPTHTLTPFAWHACGHPWNALVREIAGRHQWL